MNGSTTVISSRGQVVVPLQVRKERRWKKGTTLSFEDTPWGVMVFEVPEKPLLRLRGMLKGLDLTVDDFLKERRKEAELEEKKYKRLFGSK